MKNTVRFISLVLFVVMLASCLTACTAKQPAKDPITAEQAYENALAVSGFGEMTPVPKRDYIELYGIDCNKLEEYVWYTSDNPSLNADEICVLKVKPDNEAYLEVLATLLQKHIDTRLNNAESYSPEEAGKLRQAEVVTVKNNTGIWAYFCVGSQYSKMKTSLMHDIG